MNVKTIVINFRTFNAIRQMYPISRTRIVYHKNCTPSVCLFFMGIPTCSL